MSLFKNVMVVSFVVSDLARSRKFYSEVLGWPILWDDEKSNWVQFGVPNECGISISRWMGPGAEPPKIGGGLPVLTVEDARAATTELRDKGVRCDDVFDVPGMVSVGAFYDPDGNRVQFASNLAPRP
jgi:catechol 2,3-dioxygenase-like lactoylglutathione lyase family enzyme